MNNQPDFTPSWLGQTQRRDHLLDEVIFISICVAVGVWVHRHWHLRAVRFLTGAGIGYLVGLIGIGAAFAGDQSPAAVWLTLLLAVLPATGLGELLAKVTARRRTPFPYTSTSTTFIGDEHQMFEVTTLHNEETDEN